MSPHGFIIHCDLAIKPNHISLLALLREGIVSHENQPLELYHKEDGKMRNRSATS
jgi:hypothetical protein